jgi:hypothetical protein
MEAFPKITLKLTLVQESLITVIKVRDALNNVRRARSLLAWRAALIAHR